MGMLVIAELDDRRFAFPSQFVDRVTWAMYITPIPGQPANFKGVKNEDDIIPVIDLRYMAEYFRKRSWNCRTILSSFALQPTALPWSQIESKKFLIAIYQSWSLPRTNWHHMLAR